MIFRDFNIYATFAARLAGSFGCARRSQLFLSQYEMVVGLRFLSRKVEGSQGVTS